MDIYGQFHIGELTLLKNYSCSNRIKMSLLMKNICRNQNKVKQIVQFVHLFQK